MRPSGQSVGPARLTNHIQYLKRSEYFGRFFEENFLKIVKLIDKRLNALLVVEPALLTLALAGGRVD